MYFLTMYVYIHWMSFMIDKTLITTIVLMFQTRHDRRISLILTISMWKNIMNLFLYHISMDTSSSLAATSLVRFVMLSQKSFKLKINWLLQKTNNVPIFQAHWIYFFVVLSKLSSSVFDLLYNVRISCKQFNLYQNLFCFSITLFPNCH